MYVSGGRCSPCSQASLHRNTNMWGRAWYLFSHERDIIRKRKKGNVLHAVHPTVRFCLTQTTYPTAESMMYDIISLTSAQRMLYLLILGSSTQLMHMWMQTWECTDGRSSLFVCQSPTHLRDVMKRHAHLFLISWYIRFFYYSHSESSFGMYILSVLESLLGLGLRLSGYQCCIYYLYTYTCLPVSS